MNTPPLHPSLPRPITLAEIRQVDRRRLVHVCSICVFPPSPSETPHQTKPSRPLGRSPKGGVPALGWHHSWPGPTPLSPSPHAFFTVRGTCVAHVARAFPPCITSVPPLGLMGEVPSFLISVRLPFRVPSTPPPSYFFPFCLFPLSTHAP